MPQFDVKLSQINILNTRSAHQDTVLASFSLKVGNSTYNSGAVSLGDRGNGAFDTGLVIKNVTISDSDDVKLAISVFNLGSGNTQAVEAVAEKIISIGDDTYVPGEGEILDAIEQVFGSGSFPDCDGPCIAQVVFLVGDRMVAAAPSFAFNGKDHGTHAPASCGGSRSDYHYQVTFDAAAVSTPSGYQTRIFESATTFGNETDGTWFMADYDRDGIPDLILIKPNNTPSGNVEVHIASGASNYQTRIFESATTFGNETDGTWFMADYDRDGIPDLILIKTNNTPSGQVEVHIASGASNYQTRIFESATTFGNETDGTWFMADYDRDGIPDLILIKAGNTTFGQAEVHIASGASQYQTRIFESATTFGNETDGTWFMADYGRDGIPDLIFIKTGNTPSGNVEVHIASGASSYQTRIFESATAFGNETDGTWFMADYDRDGIPDLILIKTSNTPSGNVEVHVAKG